MKRALPFLLAAGAALASPTTTSNGSLIRYPAANLPVQYKVFDHSTTSGSTPSGK